MLRCCRRIIRLRNNGNTDFLILRNPLNMALGYVSRAPKYASWDMSSKCTQAANFAVVNDSTTHVSGRPTYNNPRLMPDAEGPSSGANILSSYDSTSGLLQGGYIGQFPASSAELPQLQLLPPSSSISSFSPPSNLTSGSSITVHETLQPSLHRERPTSTTDTISTQCFSNHAKKPAIPSQCRDISKIVESLQRFAGRAVSGSLHSVDVAALVSAFRELGPELLHMLDAKGCSELLVLFGMLSSESGSTIQAQADSRGGSYWEEVVLVARYMEMKGFVFEDGENYWSMRAYLESWKALGSIALRDMARVHYARISRKGQLEPHVLVPYLNAFLSIPSTPYYYDALDTLCNALAEQHNPDQRCVDLLWKIILTQANNLWFSHKSNIVDLLSLFTQRGELVPGLASNTVEDLATALGAPFFPSHQKSNLSASAVSWARSCVRKSLAKDVPVQERFDNLVHLAAWLLPEEAPNFSILRATPGSPEWRVIVGLAILGRSPADQAKALLEPGEIQNVARLLSHMWERHAVAERPKEIDRAVVIALLRIAVQKKDEVLFNWSMDHVLSRRLWVSPWGNEGETSQIEELLNLFADGIFAYNNRAWAILPSLLMDLSHSPPQRNRYLRSVLGRLVDCDTEIAHQIYTKCLSHLIPIPLETSIHLAQRLAARQKWNDVIPFLQDQHSGNSHLERLLGTVLRIFRNSRQDSTLPALAEAVGTALSRLYSSSCVPDQLRFPLRYFLTVMINSHRAQQTVQLLEVLAKENLTLITPRLLLRIIRALIHHRQYGLAVRTLELAPSFFNTKPRVVNQLRRKTLQALSRAGAVKLAARVESTSPPMATENLLDRIQRLSTRRHSRFLKFSLSRLISTVMTSSVHGPTVVSAVNILVQNRCFTLAKQLIGRSYKDLKSQDLTVIGNVYLHGSLRHWNVRNRSVVRHLLRTKEFFVKHYGFVPDRTTVNIAIKAMLHWRAVMDSRMIRCLFDHLIRNGYPASERWHTSHGVPFGTLPGEVTLDLSNVRQNMSFKRHIQPLYRMFIKEFFLRKDPRAACRIIGILKEVEVLAKEQKELRDKVRQAGLRKMQRKRALQKKVDNK